MFFYSSTLLLKLLLCQITSGLSFGRFVIYFVPNFALDIHIMSIDRMHAYYLIKVKCNVKKGKILIAKSIDNMFFYLSQTRFCFSIQNPQLSLIFHLWFYTKPLTIYYLSKKACLHYFDLPMLILGISFIPNWLRPNVKPLYYLSCIKFCFKCFYSINKQDPCIVSY